MIISNRNAAVATAAATATTGHLLYIAFNHVLGAILNTLHVITYLILTII